MANDAYEEQHKYIRWILVSLIISILIGYIIAFLILPVESWVRNGLDLDTLDRSIAFWKRALVNPGMVFKAYYKWWIGFRSVSHAPFSFYLPFLPIIIVPVVFFFGIATNPYQYMPDIFGSGRLASVSDVKKMKLFNGFVCVLGRFHGKLLKMPETLSALVVAPPGTGKTAGVVVPTILESDDLSIIKLQGIVPQKDPFLSSTGGLRTNPIKVFFIPVGTPYLPVVCHHWDPPVICILIPWLRCWWKNRKGGKIPTGLKRGAML